MFMQDSINLASKESTNLGFIIVAPSEPGLYVGKIIVNGREIPISISVSTKELLFDVEVTIPDSHKLIETGEKLEAQITLIPMGEDPRLDITINYIIKDFEGRTFLTESETILVEEQKTFKKIFATQNLPEGKYVLGVELNYINGMAVSSSNFEVGMRSHFLSRYQIIIFSWILAILIIVGATAFIIYRNSRIKKRIKRK